MYVNDSFFTQNYISKTTFSYMDTKIFFEPFGGWGLFFTLCLSLHSKAKKSIKKRLLVLFGFFGWKTQPGLPLQTQRVKLCMDNFLFVKSIFEHRSKFETKKEIKIFASICIFAIEKKWICISYDFHIWNCIINCMMTSIIFFSNVFFLDATMALMYSKLPRFFLVES